MKFLYIITLSVFFMSCQDKEILIPVNDNHGINEVWDNSHIFVLFQEKNGDTTAKTNLGQTISTTHWLAAVDRRLKMKHLTKPIQKILKKRHKKSIHSKEGTHAYFAFLDSTRQKMAFIDFDSIQLMSNYNTSIVYFNKYYKSDPNAKKYHLKVFSDKISLNDSINFSGFGKKQILDSLRQLTLQNPGNKNKIYLNFDNEVFFDRFLDIYTFFKNNRVPNVQLSRKIFIFTP